MIYFIVGTLATYFVLNHKFPIKQFNQYKIIIVLNFFN